MTLEERKTHDFQLDTKSYKHFFPKKIIPYLILFKQHYQKAYAILTHVARVDFD